MEDESNYCTDYFWITGSNSKEDGEETESYWNRYELGRYAENCNPKLCTNSSNGSGNLRACCHLVYQERYDHTNICVYKV